MQLMNFNFDHRIKKLDDAQAAVELQIELGDIDNDINNVAAFRDRPEGTGALRTSSKDICFRC